MLISIYNLNLAFGPKAIFHDAAFQVLPQARIGLVGPNGSGKTTLLRIINGSGEADTVTVEKRPDVSIGYLPQEGIVLPDRTVIDEVEAAASNVQTLQRQLQQAHEELQSLPADHPEYAECLERIAHYDQRLQDLEAHKLRFKAERILFGLGFNSWSIGQPCGSLSGGWQMRVALARLLLAEPDLLMLDEPTNHLDLDSLRWLEGFLRSFPGAVLLVSHDRALLDQFTHSILSIESARLVSYNGNFTSFLEQRSARVEQLEAARKNQARKIAETERFIERFRYKATKAAQVQSRIKQLAKVERLESEQQDRSIQFNFPVSRRGGQSVIRLRDIRKAYGSLRVFDGFSLQVERGDRIGVVGINGAGKSTLARIIAGRERADEGEVLPGHDIDIGYFAQDQSMELNPGDSVLQAATEGVAATETHVRSVLGAFLFSGDDMDKKVAVLSGGEKNRLALARLLLRPSNFLILDEPTNHLDMTSKAVLQEALLNYQGTTLLVSHDRHFLNPVVNKILEIQPGKCRVFPGNLEDYLWKIDQERAGNSGNVAIPGAAATSGNSESPRERRRRMARLLEEMAPLRKRISAAEERIALLEQAIAARESAMADKAFFERGGQTAQDVREYEDWKTQLTMQIDQWTELGEQLALLEAERESSGNG